jgi:hypothetical protein
VSFIDDGLKKRTELQQRQALIDEHAPKIFGDLWDRIVKHLEEAKQKGFNLFTNGSLYDRLVEIQLFPSGAHASHRESFHLTLNADKEIVIAKGQRGVKFEFPVDVCSDGIVCIKYQGQQIQTEDASILILKQFLFPEQGG